MQLPEGTKTGSYEIVGPIGAGGMGEVYRARDTALGREVAIKILPRQFAGDPERVARFEREARTLASLNHPNIAQIYGLDRSEQSLALVMELVDGDDLSQRIARGPMSLEQALAIARQIAEALDAAHGQGIVHRDLKPANVKVRSDGTIKVLDFGLAKSIEGPAASSGATITSPAMSMPGMILGTAAYMAPEQAKGRPVDKRADIWAFGCVLYEMVTGRRPFSGDDVSETIASILKEEPDWAGVPPVIEPLLVSCLQKDPRQRLRDIGDLALIVDRERAGPAVSASPIALKAIALLSIGTLLLSGVLFWRAWAAPTVSLQSTMRATLRFPLDSPLQLGAAQPSLAVSPDGKTIVYTANGPEGVQLWTYTLDSFEPKPLAGSGGAPHNVFFSPDGRQIAFFTGTQLKRMPITGGSVTVLCEVPFPFGGTWTERDEIVFSSAGGITGAGSGLWRVAATGGEKRSIKSGTFWYPDALPGGRLVLASLDASVNSRTSSELPIATVDIESGDVKPLISGGAYPRYVATGHVLFLRDGALMATHMDVSTRTASDRLSVVVPNVFMNPALASGNFAVSSAGTLVYAPGTVADFSRSLLLIDSKGQRSDVSSDRRYFQGPRASPDGQKIAVTVPGWRDTVWMFDRGRGLMTELTGGDMNGMSPVWTPDGKRIIFASYGGTPGPRNLFWMTADGSGSAERLITSEFEQRPNDWARDGKTLVFEQRTAESSDLWTMRIDDRQPRPLIATRFNESGATISPDGQLMAYVSDQSGRSEIYLTRFPSVDGRIQVSAAGGRAAVWSRDGRQLFYRDGDGEIMAVNVSTSESPTLSKPSGVVRLPRAARGGFDVMPDGRLLVVDDESAGATAEALRIVVNWFPELLLKTTSDQKSSR